MTADPSTNYPNPARTTDATTPGALPADLHTEGSDSDPAIGLSEPLRLVSLDAINKTDLPRLLRSMLLRLNQLEGDVSDLRRAAANNELRSHDIEQT